MRVTRNPLTARNPKFTKSVLEGVVQFLSLDLEATSQEYLDRHYGGARPFQLREARRLQNEIRRCLLPIASVKRQLPQAKAHLLFSGMLGTINRSRLRAELWVNPERKNAKGVKEKSNFLRPGHSSVNLLGYRWIIETDYESFSWRDRFYAVILDALKYDELWRLKVCSNDDCQKVFVQADPRQRSCSDKCRYDITNRRRSETGYHSERRKMRRRRVLNKARSLLRAGKSQDEVSAQTGLSSRVLEREGLL